MSQKDLIELLVKIKNTVDEKLKQKYLLIFIDQVLIKGDNLYLSEEFENRIEEFAFDLDYYDYNEINRAEDSIFFGTVELDKEGSFVCAERQSVNFDGS